MVGLHSLPLEGVPLVVRALEALEEVLEAAEDEEGIRLVVVAFRSRLVNVVVKS